MESSVVCD